MDAAMSSEERNAVVRMAFDAIQPMLARFDGGGAARRMEEIWNEDQQLWNGVYWKIDKWLRSWFKSHDPTATGADGEDHSGGALVEFVRECYPDRLDGQWKASELPYLLQQLSAKAKKQPEASQVPF